MDSIREIMHTPVLTIEATDSRTHARELMSANGIGHLPVLSDGEIVGVLARGDLPLPRDRQEEEELDEPPVTEDAVERLMNRPVVTLDSSASIAWAAALVRALGIGCIPVVDGHKLVGIVTKRDLEPVLRERDEGAFLAEG
jgi:acetoin utilization protein AcuB